MTVYPFVIHFGSFTVTGYGIMMMVAFLVAGWIFARELARAGLSADIAWDSVVAAVAGGIVGAKVYYALLVGDWAALFSRGGLVWYGGLMGGITAVTLYLWWKRHPILRIGDVIAAPLAAGYALGRIGCFLVGDDYGLPTTLPWGMKFPQGAPPTTARVLRQEFGVPVPEEVAPETVLAVHPTQLYEVALAFAIFVVLLRTARRRGGSGLVLGLWFVLMGLERIVVELFRAKDDRFFGSFTLAQLISALMIAAGAVLVARARRAGAAGGPG
jgi:phosphatidylglycerol:prolipoprotein diacylglycerol transferase